MAQQPDPPSFVVLADEYDDELQPASTRSSRWPGRALRDPRAGWAGAMLACLAIGGLILNATVGQHRADRPSTADRSSAADRSHAVGLPSAAAVPLPPPAGRSWPTARAACGSDRYLPIVTADPLRAATGVRVLVGGQSVHTVDLDTGRVRSATGLSLPADEFVSQLLVSGQAGYALVQPCDATGTDTVLRIDRTGQGVTLLASNRHIDQLLADGSGGVWAAEVAAIATDGPVTMVRLPGAAAVRLPAGLRPVAISGHRLIGVTGPPAQPGNPLSGDLVSFDLASGRLGPGLGRANSLTVGAGLLLWTDGPCSAAAPCALHRYDLGSGVRSVRGYALPVEASIDSGALSPDRRLLAFALPREFQQRSADVAGFGAPSDLVVLDLRTGVLEGIPNLVLPPTAPAGLAFSARGDWLVIAVDEGSSTRLLLWHSGMARPLRAGLAIGGRTLTVPPVIAAPN